MYIENVHQRNIAWSYGMDQISVFLADWQVLFREGIHFTLSGEEGLVVTGEATNNQEALDLIIKNPPQIAIININHGNL